MNQPDFKSLSRGVSRDMSPEAIARRLRIAADLYDLARILGKAKNLGRVDDAGYHARTKPEFRVAES